MSISSWMRGLSCLVALLVLTLTGCWESDPEPSGSSRADRSTKESGQANRVNVSQNIWLEVDGDTRRVLVSAEVCLRDGPLEQFLTRKGQKEHEAILAADIDARKLHEALLLTKATPGAPAQFMPRYRPASGTAIKVSVRYPEMGKTKTVNARSWIRNQKSDAELECDWVFGGSMLVEHPFDSSAPKQYIANEGDVICISNFEGALLDVPIKSSKGDEDRSYEAWTERIPPEKTKVVVVLEPVLSAKK